MRFKHCLRGGNHIHLLPLLSSLCLLLTLPPFDLSLFSWFFLVPLLFYADSKKRNYKQVFRGGFIVGSVYFIRVLFPLLSLNAWGWFNVTGTVHENKIFLLFWVLYFMVMLVGILFGFFMLLYSRFRKDSLIDVLIFSCMWVVLEYVRAKIFLSFTWGHLGYTLHENIYIVQSAKLFGVYGLSFLIIAVNILLFLILKKNVEQNIKSVKSLSFKNLLRKFNVKDPLIYTLLTFLLIPGFYGFFINNTEKRGSLEDLHVVILQPVSIEKADRNVQFDMIEEAFSKDPDLIISPTGVFSALKVDRNTQKPVEYENGGEIKILYDRLLALSEQHSCTSFVIDFVTIENNKEYASMVVFEKGKLASIYDKIYLMPFSEAWFSNKEFGIGVKGQSMEIQGVPITPLVCSEIIFPELVSRQQDSHTKFIVNIGTDGVFDSRLVAAQNHIVAKFRAIESGKYLFRAMNTGISSAIDPLGRTVVAADVNIREMLSLHIQY